MSYRHTITALTLTASSLLASSAHASSPGHLRLLDNLDRPQDGYCLDIVGSGPHIRFDMPLTAHNCKPGLYQDEAVVIDANSRIKFPAYGACATAAGLNGRALAGAAIIPRACGERSPFMDASALQRFKFHQSGKVELEGSGLCLTVGETSASTFDDDHRWRALFLDSCTSPDSSRNRWEFRIPTVR